MHFTSQNVDDIIRYFRNTFIKFKETGDTLYYIKYVDPYKVEGTSENGDILKIYLDTAHPYEVEYVLPHKSYYQLGDHAAMLQRMPAKQYQRGCNSENTKISMLVEGTAKNVAVEFSTLTPFVNKHKFYSISECVSNPDKKASMVVTPRMAYEVLSQRLYMDFTPIGKLIATVKGAFIRLEQPIFEAEVRAMLESYGEQDKIKVLKRDDKVS